MPENFKEIKIENRNKRNVVIIGITWEKRNRLKDFMELFNLIFSDACSLELPQRCSHDRRVSLSSCSCTLLLQCPSLTASYFPSVVFQQFVPPCYCGRGKIPLTPRAYTPLLYVLPAISFLPVLSK